MRLKVLRLTTDDRETPGALYIDGELVGFTLEDEHRASKVPGETRIPAGVYRVVLRTEGGKNAYYAAKYGGWHKGMLWVQGVPGFSFILIHIGNDGDDTAGCLLVGDRPGAVERNVLYSTDTYRRIYPRVAAAIEAGMSVTIEYVDYVA